MTSDFSGRFTAVGSRNFSCIYLKYFILTGRFVEKHKCVAFDGQNYNVSVRVLHISFLHLHTPHTPCFYFVLLI